MCQYFRIATFFVTEKIIRKELAQNLENEAMENKLSVQCHITISNDEKRFSPAEKQQQQSTGSTPIGQRADLPLQEPSV